MDEFDLGRLTDFDFELLCKDLFEVVLEIPLEVFARGRDGGVDLRYIAPAFDDTTVIQCKHWIRSGRDALISHLKKTELAKVKRLAPQRYLVATTVELTVAAKNEIAAIFPGYLQSPGDVFGAHEIVALLRNHPEIVSRHIRLWLASSSVLSSLLNRDVLSRSRALAADIDESLRRFVPHAGRDRARRLLDEQHSCLIVGPPGVGKTTLAHVLLADLHAEGYTIVEATNRLDDVHRMWDDEEKQVFFVDDFVGQSTLDDGAARVANQELPRLLRMIRKTATKRLVLTGRNYLVIQAGEHYERLDARGLDPYECGIDSAGFDRKIRAEIFYNHIFFSELSAEQQAELAQPHVYRAIIGHRNYSPRLLEHALAEAAELPGDTPGNVANIVRHNLDNPAHLWKRLIEEVLEADELALVMVLYTANRSANHDRLRVAWRTHLGLPANSDTDRRFRRSLRRLEPVIARVFDEDDERRVMFSNPSIVDFLNGHLPKNRELVGSLLDSAVYLDQLINLWALSSWWAVPVLRETLTREPQRLHDAVVRIDDRSPMLGRQRSDHDTAAATFIVALGRFDESPQLAAVGTEVLDELLDGAEPMASTLHQLTVDVANSPVSAWWTYAEELAERTYSAAIDQVVEWEDTDRLDAVLDDLAKLSRKVALLGKEGLRAQKFAVAVRELEKWADEDHEADIEEDTLEEILDFMDREDHDLDEEYRRAREFLEREPEDETAPAVEPTSPSRPSADLIDSMFSTLRDD